MLNEKRSEHMRSQCLANYLTEFTTWALLIFPLIAVVKWMSRKNLRKVGLFWTWLEEMWPVVLWW